MNHPCLIAIFDDSDVKHFSETIFGNKTTHDLHIKLTFYLKLYMRSGKHLLVFFAKLHHLNKTLPKNIWMKQPPYLIAIFNKSN